METGSWQLFAAFLTLSQFFRIGLSSSSSKPFYAYYLRSLFPSERRNCHQNTITTKWFIRCRRQGQKKDFPLLFLDTICGSNALPALSFFFYWRASCIPPPPPPSLSFSPSIYGFIFFFSLSLNGSATTRKRSTLLGACCPIHRLSCGDCHLLLHFFFRLAGDYHPLWPSHIIPLEEAYMHFYSAPPPSRSIHSPATRYVHVHSACIYTGRFTSASFAQEQPPVIRAMQRYAFGRSGASRSSSSSSEASGHIVAVLEHGDDRTSEATSAADGPYRSYASRAQNSSTNHLNSNTASAVSSRHSSRIGREQAGEGRGWVAPWTWVKDRLPAWGAIGSAQKKEQQAPPEQTEADGSPSPAASALRPDGLLGPFGQAPAGARDSNPASPPRSQRRGADPTDINAADPPAFNDARPAPLRLATPLNTRAALFVPVLPLSPVPRGGGPASPAMPASLFLEALSHSSESNDAAEDISLDDADGPQIPGQRGGGGGLLGGLWAYLRGETGGGAPQNDMPVLIIAHRGDVSGSEADALTPGDYRRAGPEDSPIPLAPFGRAGREPATLSADEARTGSTPMPAAAAPVDHVILDPSDNPFANCNASPMLRTVRRPQREPVNEVEGGMDSGTSVPVPESMTVDLVSALRGYLQSYSECMTHLVEAALASRSREKHNLVTFEELQEAQGNPFLYRMIVVKEALDIEDVQVQEAVSNVVHSLIEESSEDHLSPALLDYLVVFFQLPFVSLTEAEYRLLKRSGFEFIALMHANQHVLPTTKTIFSIRVNNSSRMWWVNFVFMLLGFAANMVVSISVVYEISRWMAQSTSEDVSYGFYACITLAVGYVLTLIIMIVVLRPVLLVSESTLPKNQKVPSLYINVIPLLPLYDIAAMIKFIQLRRIPRQERYLVAMHNIFAISRVMGIYHCLFYAMPQVQLSASIMWDGTAIFASVTSPTALLAAATAAQFIVVLIRVLWMSVVYDSTHRFGVAWYAISRWRKGIAAHSGMARALLVTALFVLEMHLYLVAVNVVNVFRGDCIFLSALTAALSFATCLLIVITLLLFKNREQIPIVTLCAVCSLPLTAGVVALIVLVGWTYADDICRSAFRQIADDYSFGFFVQGAYLVMFVLWGITSLLLVLRVYTRVPIRRFSNYFLTKFSRATEVVSSKEEAANAARGRRRNSGSDDLVQFEFSSDTTTTNSNNNNNNNNNNNKLSRREFPPSLLCVVCTVLQLQLLNYLLSTLTSDLVYLLILNPTVSVCAASLPVLSFSCVAFNTTFAIFSPSAKLIHFY
eukprot:gene11916-8198_t